VDMEDQEGDANYAKGRWFLKSNWDLLAPPFLSDMARGLPPPVQEEAPEPGAWVLKLPDARTAAIDGPKLVELLESRKSRRKYDPEKYLTLEELAFLCWAAEGIREHRPKYSFRTSPSGGCRHPLDLYVYAQRCRGLDQGLYRYLPVEHSLVLTRSGEDAERLNLALVGQFWNAAAAFIWVALPIRTEWRYGPVAHKIVALDAGHSCQNLYLACEAAGLSTCAIANYDQGPLDAFLGLDGEDRFGVYTAVIGIAETGAV